MGMRIQQLPQALANQIAAGEVIERPASVVKELLENSLDAGATNITLEIGYGGLNRIKISDNGRGIVAEDLLLAVAPHATSKISTFHDLYTVDTMGFRGEALASIASVSKLSISARTAEQEHAMLLSIAGSKPAELIMCPRTVGTTVDVVDIFFNAPVRKRFLKSEQLEFQAIEMVVKRFALSAPHITLTLKHNNKLIITLPAVTEHNKSLRIAKIFGTAFMQEAIYLDVESAGMRLNGWLSGPNVQRSQNDRQWVYINQRMVRDKLINHALKQVYEGLLHPGRFPVCLLYFTIPSKDVDVNVHPTKHEVRFVQARMVHDFFTSQLTKALHSQGLQTPSVVTGKLVEGNVPRESNNYVFPEDSRTNLKIAEPYHYSNHAQPNPSKQRFEYAPQQSWTILHNRYLLIIDKTQPLLVDTQTLFKKWLLIQLENAALPWPHRPLLVPISFDISKQLFEKFDALRAACESLGLLLEKNNTHQLTFRSIPLQVPYLDFKEFLTRIEQVDSYKPALLIDIICSAQSFHPHLLTSAEQSTLQEFLMAHKDSNEDTQGFYKSLQIEDCRKLLHE